MESKREKYKYYYKKPGGNVGDPSVLMSSKDSSKGGEIIIGKEDVSFSNEQMIVLLVRSTLDKDFHKTIQKQKEYFGENNYEPVRQEIIRLNKCYLQILVDEGIKMPVCVSRIIFSENWPF